MTTPSVVEKSLAEIGLNNGVNEFDREEVLDWQKDLSQAENLIYTNAKALSLRPGMQFYSSTDDAGNSLLPVRRMVRLDNGVGCVSTGKGIQGSKMFRSTTSYPMVLFQAEESTGQVTSKGPVSEFSVTPITMGSDSGGIPTSGMGIIGVANLTKFTVMAWYVSNNNPANGSQMCMVIKDRESGDTVRKYFLKGIDGKACFQIVGVADRYIHVYSGSTNTTRGKFLQLDTQALPADIATVSTVNLADSGPLRGAVAIATGSVVATELALQEFGTGGTSLATGSTTGLTKTTGIDTDGTNFYTCGYLSGAPNRFIVKRWDNTLTVTSTVTDTTATNVDANACIRCASDPSGNLTLVAYTTETLLAGNASSASPVATIFSLTVGGTTFANNTADFAGGPLGYLPMFVEGSLPFYHAQSGKVYVHLHNLSTNSAGTDDFVANSSVLLDLSAASSGETSAFVTNNGQFPFVQYRPVAVLDNYIASTSFMSYNASRGGYNYKGLPSYRPHTDTTGFSTLCGVASQLSLISTSPLAYTAVNLQFQDASAITFHDNNFSGGLVGTYDGVYCSEYGFTTIPCCFATTNGAGNLTGSYNYVAVFSYADGNGNVHYSRTSKVSNISLTNQQVSLAVTVPSATMHPVIPGVTVSLYRTLAGGTQYFLVAKQAVVITSPATVVADCVVSFSDNATDAVVGAQPVLFRQPGTPGTPLDRYHGLAGTHITAHNDRVFYCRGSSIYYSSFKVDGESFWFNPAFSFNVPNGSGPITGLASMDGVLVVFKRNAVFLIEGDGPPENGGSGAEFSTPRRINTEYGCIEPRSVVLTPLGVMYQSGRGFELLNRSFQIEAQGLPIQTTIKTYPYCGGSAFDVRDGQVLFAMGDTLLADGTLAPNASGGHGAVVCFNIIKDCWTVLKYLQSAAGGTGQTIQDICYPKAQAETSIDTENIFLGASTGIYYHSTLVHTDWNGSAQQFVPWSIRTGWVKAPGTQDRLKITDLFILGAFDGNHQIKVSYSRDYNKTDTLVKLFPSATVASTSPVVQLNANIPIESAQAMQFLVQSVVTDDPGGHPTQAAGQIDIYSIAVRLGLKGGGAKLAVGQKG